MCSACWKGAPRRHNGLGIAGFVVSLVGIVTCGVLGPVGLLLSLFALRKGPRGLATTGVVLGLLSTLWLGALGAGAVRAFHHAGPAARRAVDDLQHLQATLAAATQASQDLQLYRMEHGDWPESEAGQEVVSIYHDAYGTPLRYTRVDEMILVISAGADREFATPDDVSLDPLTMATVQKPEAGKGKHRPRR